MRQPLAANEQTIKIYGQLSEYSYTVYGVLLITIDCWSTPAPERVSRQGSGRRPRQVGETTGHSALGRVGRRNRQLARSVAEAARPFPLPDYCRHAGIERWPRSITPSTVASSPPYSYSSTPYLHRTQQRTPSHPQRHRPIGCCPCNQGARSVEPVKPPAEAA